MPGLPGTRPTTPWQARSVAEARDTPTGKRLLVRLRDGGTYGMLPSHVPDGARILSWEDGTKYTAPKTRAKAEAKAEATAAPAAAEEKGE